MEAVPADDLDADGALLLGEALYELGDFGAAERVLARGQQLPASEHVALRLAVTRAKSLLIKGAGRARRSRLGSFRRDRPATALTTIGQRG